MATTFADLEARVRGQDARLQRNEEDITALISTATDTRRRAARLELLVERIAEQMNIPVPTDAEVDAALGDD